MADGRGAVVGLVRWEILQALEMGLVGCKHRLWKIILVAVLNILESLDPGDRVVCLEDVELNQA